MSLRTRFVIFCIGLLLIGLASLAVLLAALTGRIESSPTGVAVSWASARLAWAPRL